MSKLKVGLSALHYPVTMARYLWNALERRDDCEVYAVGPFFDDWIPWNNGMTLPKKYVKVPYLPLPKNTAQLKVPYQAVVNQMPNDLDLFLVIDAGWHFANRPDAEIVALIETDPHVLKSHYQIPKAYSDFTFCMQTPYIVNDEKYLAYGYDPEIHFYEEQEKIYDVCLIGLHYNSRSDLVYALRNKGYKVYYDIGPAYDDYRKLYNQSKIALSWSSRDDLCARNWEALAMKNLLVTNRVTDMKSFFVENDHYLGFDTIEEAVAKVDWALNNPKEADKIASAGHRKVRHHTWDARISQLLETVRLR